MAADPNAALVAPRVTDRTGRVLRGTLRRFPDPWKSFMTFSGLWRLAGRWPAFRGVERSSELPGNVTAAEAVSGACMLLRKDAFFAIGGMDSDYRLHCEDLDLMYRLRQAGHHCLLVPEAVAIHDQGTSSSSRPLWVHWQKHRGMQRFFDKFQAANHALPVRWAVRAGIWSRFLVTLPRPLWQAARRALRPN
jgi:GT2 family glycosyltransferase